MIIGCCFICVFAVLINKVSLQVTVKAVIGGSVVLPCSSTEHDLNLQDINVLWRDKDSETIYDLIKGEDSVEGQDPRYKNRVQTFPKEYERGNFSIKLTNLTHTDSGEFSCFITHSSNSKQEIVNLLINESTAEKGNASTEQENQGPDLKIVISVSILLPVLLIVMAIITYFIYRWKKTHHASFIEGRVAK